MGFGQPLNVVGAACQWAVVDLRVLDLHQVQNNLGILEIIFVPAVMKGLACATNDTEDTNFISKPAAAR